MFSLRKPTREIINNYLEEQSKKPFSYAETGALQTGYPKGYVHVNRSVLLGKGEQTFLKGNSMQIRTLLVLLALIVSAEGFTARSAPIQISGPVPRPPRSQSNTN